MKRSNRMRPELATLEAFATIASLRSFRKAADKLGVSASSLSHLLHDLEEQVGVRLLNRTTRSVAPTPAGELLLERLPPVFAGLDDALGAIDALAGEPRGALRINTGAVGARVLLREIVPAFRAKHPPVQLELVTDERLVDIVADGFDAGVRLMEAVPRDMVAVRFGGDARFVAVASPRYLARHGTPRTPGDLSAHECLRQRLRSGQVYRWEFERRGHELTVDVPGSLTLDDVALLTEAARSGLGLALVPEAAAAQALADGSLRMVLADWCPRIGGLALYHPGHRRMPAALRAFIDVLKASETKATTSDRRGRGSGRP